MIWIYTFQAHIAINWNRRHEAEVLLQDYPNCKFSDYYDQSDLATYISLLVESQLLPFLELLTAPFRARFS